MPIIIKHCYNNNLNLKNCVVNSFVKFLVILFENNLYLNCNYKCNGLYNKFFQFPLPRGVKEKIF